MHAVVEIAVQLAVAPVTVVADDLAALRAHGLTEDDVWDVGAIVSLFALSNRLVHRAAVPPNEEFHLMGRVPPSWSSGGVPALAADTQSAPDTRGAEIDPPGDPPGRVGREKPGLDLDMRRPARGSSRTVSRM